LNTGKYLRQFFTEPDAQLHNRSIYWPRGWVVGGSSTVNGMMWIHGTPHEYNRWAQDGCPGWAHADLLPWFKKIEDFSRGDPQFRGQGGPVTITEYQPVDPLADAFLDSVEQAGVAPRVKDYNARGYGGSYTQFNTRNGVRCNTRMAYLDPAKGRSNLVLKTGAMVERVVLEKMRATAVMVRINGQVSQLKARLEIILSGGAFNSPQLLELSGVGRREVLSQAGVPLMLELPLVGENLSEHVYSPMAYRIKPGYSWNQKLRSPLTQARLGLRWLMRHDGPLATNTISAQVFASSLAGSTEADVKLQIQQVTSASNRGVGKAVLDSFEGATIASFQICPKSRGSCHITSSNPAADPRLISNHFTHDDDINACLNALKMSRKVAATGPMAQLIEEEKRPGAKTASDEALIDYLRVTGATAWHPVGSCRIGTDAAQSVVDTRLRVHGVQGLRVADASVMPSIAATNTNAIAIAIGERAANFILQETH
jgi:choline dehydrogenase